MSDVIMKPVTSKPTVNGAAYINPNSLKIPPTTVQRVDSPAKDESLLSVSGVLVNRFDDPRYYTGDAVT